MLQAAISGQLMALSQLSTHVLQVGVFLLVATMLIITLGQVSLLAIGQVQFMPTQQPRALLLSNGKIGLLAMPQVMLPMAYLLVAYILMVA